MRVQRTTAEPIRPGMSWSDRWEGSDDGLIACWERGREVRNEDPAAAAQAQAGRLLILPWKGGVEKRIKKTKKFGCLFYLAMWQGLRGEDLDIDTAVEVAMTCSLTEMTVVFTADQAKYAEA